MPHLQPPDVAILGQITDFFNGLIGLAHDRQNLIVPDVLDGALAVGLKLMH